MLERTTSFPYPRSVFAGSNTADGFVSQFDILLRGCLRVYILKGSPGAPAKARSCAPSQPVPVRKMNRTPRSSALPIPIVLTA